MVGIKDLEESYNFQLEKLSKNFAKNLSLATSLEKKGLEKSYKKDLDFLLEKHRRELESFIRKNPSKVFEENSELSQKKNISLKKTFLDVKPLKLETSTLQKFSIRFALWRFHSKIKLRNFFFSITPRVLTRFYYNLKFFIKVNLRDSLDFIWRFFYRRQLNLLHFFEYLKQSINAFFIKCKNIFQDLISRFKFKKQENPDNNSKSQESKDPSQTLKKD